MRQKEHFLCSSVSHGELGSKLADKTDTSYKEKENEQAETEPRPQGQTDRLLVAQATFSE